MESSRLVPNIQQYITTNEYVCYHKLQQDNVDHKQSVGFSQEVAADEDDQQRRIAFLWERISEELTFIASRRYEFSLSQVAILFDDETELKKYEEPIKDMLLWLGKFNRRTQTIEDMLVSENSRDIVLDVYENVMSFEAPCVIFIRAGNNIRPYNLMSRPRTKLIIIDIVPNEPPLNFQNVQLITWKGTNNSFYKVLNNTIGDVQDPDVATSSRKRTLHENNWSRNKMEICKSLSKRRKLDSEEYDSERFDEESFGEDGSEMEMTQKGFGEETFEEYDNEMDMNFFT